MMAANSPFGFTAAHILSDTFLVVSQSILLIWLPAGGSFLAGLIGARRFQTVPEGMLSSLIAAVVLGIILGFLSPSLTALPVVGALARTEPLCFVLIYSGSLILGYLLGVWRGKK